ncbi:MAG: TrmO family methyltransferase [Candidatus Hodarchaeota archaeon]
MNGHDKEESRNRLQMTPPYGNNPPITGVFASRAEYRPNPIALTTSKILDVDYEEGLIKVGNIDAFDNTPVLDLKAYFPVCDRVKDAKIPDWIVGWPEWLPDEGLGLEIPDN